MATIKTAISVDKELFDKAEKLAKQVHVTRSQLYSQAVEYMVTRNENLALVREINRACEYGQVDENEKRVVKELKRKSERLVEEW